jgi:small subunit ribosomal protein S3
MGHKVHPTGIRLGIAKDWNSKWYANKADYAKYLVADLKVREMLRKKLLRPASRRFRSSVPPRPPA